MNVRAALPNLIPCLRLALLGPFIWAVLEGRATLAFLLLAGIAFSDALDGYLARRWRVESRFGKVLDPLADKLAQVTGLILLAAERPGFGHSPPLLVAFVFARDIFLAYGSYRIQRRFGRVIVEPKWEGKACTLVIFLLLFAACLNVAPHVILALSAASGLLVVLSTIRYARDGVRQARARSGP